MKHFDIEEYQMNTLRKERLQMCYDKKWFKLFVPKAYGGKQASMKEGCQSLLEAASLQGGLGWLVNLGAGANWFSGFLEDEVATSIFSPRKAVIAGSGFVNGTWEKHKDEYYINGNWSKCTGAAHATYFSLVAKNNKGEKKTFVVPRAEIIQINENWPTMGLKNASSSEIVLENARIPVGNDFEINTIKNNADYSVFHIPFASFARLCMSATFLGGVHCLLNACRKFSRKDKTQLYIEKVVCPILNEAMQLLQYSAETIEKTSEVNREGKNHEELLLPLGKMNGQLFTRIQELFFLEGLQFIEEDSLIQWAYRDVITMMSHHFVKPNIAFS